MKMLGRKQSIKQDTILADYGGNEELLNESTDVEWVNKVQEITFINRNVLLKNNLISMKILRLSGNIPVSRSWEN